MVGSLEPDEVLVGSDVARRFGVGLDEPLRIEGRAFEVLEILPETGTVDDARIFAHLHVVQEMGKTGAVVNAVEIVGCCREISKGLVADLERLLPATRVVTVTQIVSTPATRSMAPPIPLISFPGIMYEAILPWQSTSKAPSTVRST